MANKQLDKYLSLYPEDFHDDIWNDVCDVVNISPEFTELRIYFTPSDIVSELPEDDDLYEEEF